MEEKLNDYQLSFLHNILNRPVSRPIEKKEVVPLNNYPPKSVTFRIFPVNSPPKKLTKRRHIEKLKSTLPIKQPKPKKSNSTLYVFNQVSSYIRSISIIYRLCFAV